jgi:hypothetical protein
MAVESRIRELDHRHRDLDAQIEAETRRPAADLMKIGEMKRQKLKIKEEIERLRERTRH